MFCLVLIKFFYMWELFAWSSHYFSLYFNFIKNGNLSAVWRIQTLSQCKSKVIHASLSFLVLSQVCMGFMFEKKKNHTLNLILSGHLGAHPQLL